MESLALWIAVIFASLFIADRITAVFINKAREEEQTTRYQASVDQFKDMTDKAVRTIQALNGGVAEAAMRMPYIDPMPEEKANGSAPRYTPTPPPPGFSGHRAPAEAR
jgi:hypothetical protein